MPPIRASRLRSEIEEEGKGSMVNQPSPSGLAWCGARNPGLKSPGYFWASRWDLGRGGGRQKDGGRKIWRIGRWQMAKRGNGLKRPREVGTISGAAELLVSRRNMGSRRKSKANTMKHLLQIFTCMGTFLGLQLLAADGTPPVPKRGWEIANLKVLKVYSATNGTEIFRSYVVKWKDQEVVVSDVLSETSHQVGDTITVEVIHFPRQGTRNGIVSFVINEPRAMANPQGGANGRQPPSLGTNQTAAAAAPPRAP